MTGPRDLLRASQDRDFGQEGIPMVLALVDETASPPGAAVPQDGDGDLVALLDRLRSDLAPTRRDDDLGVTTALLAAAAFADDGGS